MKRKFKKSVKLSLLVVIILLGLFITIKKININKVLDENNSVKTSEKEEEPKIEEPIEPKVTNVSITAVGDCTLGSDDRTVTSQSFVNVYKDKGEDYFFGGVKDIFALDDLTIINLEGTFTDSTDRTPNKTYTFKAPSYYANMLPKASIEACNIANNHSHDFGESGYLDTVKALEDVHVNYFGNEYYYVFEKDGIKIGLGGVDCEEDPTCTTNIDTMIKTLKDKEVDSIILTFHWGIETHYNQSAIQTTLGHYAIDHGADLVLGHHPHRIQGIELYNGKYIVYSLGNFSFGGNRNPKDKDSFIFQIDFTYENKKIIDSKINVIPVSISSKTNVNDYRPTILTGSEKDRVMEKIAKYSVNVSLT